MPTLTIPGDMQPDPEVMGRLKHRTQTSTAADGTKSSSQVLTQSDLNLCHIVMQDARWKGRFRANLLDGQVYIDDRPLTDSDVTGLCLWMDAVYGLRAKPGPSHGVLAHIAEMDAYHPVQVYLEARRWDRRPRVASLLTAYFGAPSSPLHSATSRAWMIAAVARAMIPGCKVDSTLILVGPQGGRKSSAFRALAGSDWFSDSMIDIRNKDSYLALRGVWIYELAELDSIQHRDNSNVKAFLTGQIDKYRPPYGRCNVSYPRSCVIVGTTNKHEPLHDPTGARRFWPVSVGRIDIGALERDRDQLWAEAMHLWRGGERWWLDDAREIEMAIQADGYTESHPWETPIRDWLATHQYPFEMADLLTSGLELKIDQQKGVSHVVGGILTRMGYSSRARTNQAGARVRMWVQTPKDEGERAK